MIRKSNAKGLALGAVFALVASLFGAMPASAATANDDTLVLVPVEGPASNFNGVLTDDFNLEAYLLPGKNATDFRWEEANVVLEVTRVSGNLDLVISTRSAIAAAVDPGSTSDVAPYALLASETTETITAVSVSSGVMPLTIRAYTASGIVSSSANLVVKFKVWVENLATANEEHDELEIYSEKTVTLWGVNSIAATTTLNALDSGEDQMTASSTITTDLNFENLGATKFFLSMEADTDGTFAASSGTTSFSPSLGTTVLKTRAGVVSDSFAVAYSDGVTESMSVSAQLRMHTTAATAYDDGYAIGAAATRIVSAPGVDTLLITPVIDSNNTESDNAIAVRPNQTYTFKIGTQTTSGTATASNIAVTVTVASSNLSFPEKTLSVNGAAVTDSATIETTVTTGADGYATLTVKAAGLEAGNAFTVDAAVGNVEYASAVTVTMAAPYYTITNDYDLLKTTPGAAVTLGYTVKDQWGQKSAAAGQRLKLTRSGDGFSYATTVSYATVTAGDASFTFTPEPATATGSAAVAAVLQTWNAGSAVWADDAVQVADSNVSINVSSLTDAITSAPVASVSASISYAVANDSYSWSPAIYGDVENAGSVVQVASSGLIFIDTNGDTSSNAITLRADSSGVYSFSAAATMAGTYTVSITVGSTTTTSQVIISDAASDLGATITFDTTEIVAGKTRVVTGTLVDANGNPVNTTGAGTSAGDSGTASIVVTYTGTAGVPVGSMPTETDADGKFKVSILTSAADSGTFTLTATYLPQGAATVAAKKVTKVQEITVGETATSGSDDQKVNAGSFKGYVAVYAKGYEGQRLSAKVGNDWVVVPALASNFVRVVEFTGAGYTIAVRIYIDRVLVDTITVTTK